MDSPGAHGSWDGYHFASRSRVFYRDGIGSPFVRDLVEVKRPGKGKKKQENIRNERDRKDLHSTLSYYLVT